MSTDKKRMHNMGEAIAKYNLQINQLQSDNATLRTRVADSGMMVRRLVHALSKECSAHPLIDKASGWLKRYGLQGSPLRSENDG